MDNDMSHRSSWAFRSLFQSPVLIQNLEYDEALPNLISHNSGSNDMSYRVHAFKAQFSDNYTYKYKII